MLRRLPSGQSTATDYLDDDGAGQTDIPICVTVTVRSSGHITFDFTGSAVTSLAPRARVLVVKNASAFAARYGGGLPVAGQFVGNLDNNGERIQLLDAGCPLGSWE